MREYRGGVLNLASGVGAADEGSRPSSWRWADVRGMSDRSSFGRIKGRHATPMLTKGMS